MLSDRPVQYTQTLDEGPVRKWYEANQHRQRTFQHIVYDFMKQGYKLNAENGLLFRAVVSPEVQEEIGHTLVDIVSLRPVDMHKHTDVTEYINVLSGSGIMFTGEKGMRIGRKIDPTQWTTKTLDAGDQITIPRYIPHCFTPADLDHSHLEIRLACSGILKGNCEKQIKPFYEWPKELL